MDNFRQLRVIDHPGVLCNLMKNLKILRTNYCLIEVGKTKTHLRGVLCNLMKNLKILRTNYCLIEVGKTKTHLRGVKK